MHVFLKGQIFRQSQRYLRGDQTLYHRVIGQVDKHRHMGGYSALLKSTAEKFRHIMLDSHRSKYDCKLLVRIISQGRLLHDLSCQLIVRQPIARKDRQLLTADQSHQTIDR